MSGPYPAMRMKCSSARVESAEAGSVTLNVLLLEIRNMSSTVASKTTCVV